MDERASTRGGGDVHHAGAAANASPRGSVLVVDEEPDARSRLADHFFHLGWEAASVSSPLEAIGALSCRPWSLVLVGRVCGGTGEEFVATLRRVVPRLRVGLAADLPTTALERRIERIGALGCVSRSGDLPRLRTLVARVHLPEADVLSPVAFLSQAEITDLSEEVSPLTSLEATSPSLLLEGFGRAIASGSLDLPGRGDLLPRLQALAADPEAGADEVCRTLESDPAVVAAVVSATNVAGAAFASTATTLQQACVRLGNQMVLALGQQVAIRSVFRLRQPPWSELAADWWRHCEATSQLARLLAARAGLSAEDGFLAGLLANLGELALLAEAERWDDGTATDALVGEVTRRMAAEHARIGRDLLQAWSFDRAWCRLALRHHEPDPGSLGALSLLCSGLAAEQGLGYCGAPPPAEPGELDRLARGLGIDPAVAREMAEAVVAGVRAAS